MSKNRSPYKNPNLGRTGSNTPSKTGNPIATESTADNSTSKMEKKTSSFSNMGGKKETEKRPVSHEFVFSKKNYQWMFIGIGVLILGFYLMSGTTDIMSSTKIVLAPFLVLVGFGIEFYAILLNPDKNSNLTMKTSSKLSENA